MRGLRLEDLPHNLPVSVLAKSLFSHQNNSVVKSARHIFIGSIFNQLFGFKLECCSEGVLIDSNKRNVSFI